MRKAWIALLLFACGLGRAEEPPPLETHLPIIEVTVAPGEAMVVRSGTVGLPAGRSTIRVLDLPAALMQDSLRVNVDPGVLLESTDLSLVATRAVLPKEILAVEDNIDAAQQEIKSIEDRQKLLGTELAVLEAFAPGNMKSDNWDEPVTEEPAPVLLSQFDDITLNPDAWLKVIDFVSGRAETTRQALAHVATRKNLATARLKELQANLAELRKTTVPARLVADLRVEAKQAVKMPLTIRYAVGHVIWYPVYEFRASNNGRSINVQRQALVAQNTGEDWTGVRMSLSTLPPQRSVEAPQLPVWRIGHAGLHDSVERDDFGNDRPGEERFGSLAAVEKPDMLWLKYESYAARANLGKAFDYRDTLAQESIRMGMTTLAGVRGGGRFGFRNGGGRGNSVRRGGGSRSTESAVDKSLQYLASQQRSDGSWNDTGREQHTVGITSLSLLSFLGAGHSTRFGKYRKNVSAAADYLVRATGPDGRMGNSLFDQSTGVTALAECFGMSGDRRLAEPARRALLHLDQRLRARMYLFIPDLTVDRFPGGIENLGFAAGAAKSAKVAGLPVPPSLFKSLEILANQIEQTHSGPRMAAAVGITRAWLGADRARLKPYTDILRTTPPRWEPGQMHLGYMYLGTLLCFQQGIRSEAWKEWNPALKSAFMKTGKNGGWPARDVWFGTIGSRVATTAAVSTFFEIYYRYSDAHGSDDSGMIAGDGASRWTPVAPQVASKGRLYHFPVNGLRTVRADGKYHRISIDGRETKGTPRHVTVPVVYEGVFLQSEFANPFDIPLMEGVARVFLDAEFIGETRMPGAEADESITIPLGEDPMITVGRSLDQKALTEKDTDPLRTLAVDIGITLENRRTTPAQVLVRDRLATSQDTRVRIRNPRLKGGDTHRIDDGNGTAEWTVAVPPGKTASVSGHYEVEYPKDVIPSVSEELKPYVPPTRPEPDHDEAGIDVEINDEFDVDVEHKPELPW